MLSHQQEERRGQAVSCCTGASLAPTCPHQPSAPQPSQLTSPLNHPSAHQSSKLWDTQCLLALPWAEPQHPKPPGERGNGGLGGKLTRKYQGPQGHTVTFLPLSFYFFLTNPNQGKWVGGQRERERDRKLVKNLKAHTYNPGGEDLKRGGGGGETEITTRREGSKKKGKTDQRKKETRLGEEEENREREKDDKGAGRQKKKRRKRQGQIKDKCREMPAEKKG